MSEKQKKKGKRGPKPERVKIDEDWEDAIEKALKKKRPNKGWPDHKDEKSHSDGDKGRVEDD